MSILWMIVATVIAVKYDKEYLLPIVILLSSLMCLLEGILWATGLGFIE